MIYMSLCQSEKINSVLIVKINNRQLNELYANTIYNNITQVSRKGIYV